MQWKRKLLHLPKAILLTLSQPHRDRILYKLIQGKRVLILGGGPSAEELTHIPEDVLVLSCNTAPGILIEKTISHPLNLYLANKNTIGDYEGRIEEILPHFSIDVFVSRDVSYIQNTLKHISFKHLLLDRFAGNKSNYGIQRVFGYDFPWEEVNKTARKSPSSGVGLLLYALCYEAKEIYLAGIDLDTQGSAFTKRAEDVKGDTFSHQPLDTAVAKKTKKRFSNIYVISSTSPLTSLFPFKKL